jgi:HEAT repeat protein
MKYVISKIMVLMLLLIVCTVNINAQTYLEKKVDSLFVIASSAEHRFFDMVEPAKDSIAAMGKDVVPHLVSKFDTKSARERMVVIHILKRIGSPAVPYLITSLKNPNGLIVQRVCWALGDIADSTALEPLIDVSSHKRWQVRDQALGAIGDIKNNRGADAIFTGFTDSVAIVRKAAAVAAGKIVILEAIPNLVHQLGDDFYGARMSAAEALLKLDTSMVMGVISDSIMSENYFVGSLGCAVLGDLKNDEAIDILKNIFETAPVRLQSHAALAIIKSDPEDRCEYHQALLENTNDRLTKLKIESSMNPN